MWVLPTYDRPERAQKALDSIQAAGCSTPGIVFVDGSQRIEYRSLRLPAGWKLVQQNTNQGVCSSLNQIFSMYPDAPWYGFISDDSVVETPQFDLHLLKEVTPFSIVHSADGWQSEERIHGAVIFGGKLLRALGWWVPPGLTHSFCDNVWEAIAESLNLRKYLPHVLVEHRHVANGKAPVDWSYLKAYSSFESDQAAFLKWKKQGLKSAVERVKRSIDCLA